MLNKFTLKLARGLPRENHAGRPGQANLNSQRRQGWKTRVLRKAGAFCALLAAAGLLLPAASVQAGSLSPSFNQPGNILIADQFNNRVIEAKPNGDIVWSFGLGPLNFSPQSIIGCNDAQRVGPLTLMAGTGTPPNVIPQIPGGAADNRVILVDPFGRIIWQYGQFGQTGSGPNLLSTPVQCTWLPSFHVLITDQANNRIIEVNLRKQIVWSYPGSNTNAGDQLNNPNSAELLENGNVLISDENNSRAIEVTRADQISERSPPPIRLIFSHSPAAWRMGTRCLPIRATPASSRSMPTISPSGNILRAPTRTASPCRCRPARFGSATATP